MSGRLAVTLGQTYTDAVRRNQAHDYDTKCRNAFAKHLFVSGTGFRTKELADTAKARSKALRERLGKHIPIQAGFGGVLHPQEIRDTDKTKYWFQFTEDTKPQHTSNSPWGWCTNGDLSRVHGLQGKSRWQYVYWSKFMKFYQEEQDTEFADELAYLAFHTYQEALIPQEEISPSCLFYDSLANLLRTAFPNLSEGWRGYYLEPLFSDHHGQERREVLYACVCIAVKGDWTKLTSAWKENRIAYVQALPTAKSFKNNDIYMASILAALKEFYDNHM